MKKFLKLIKKFFLLRNMIPNKVIFIYRKNTDNVGDLFCTPRKYLKLFSRCKEIDIIEFEQMKNVKNKILIVGGGGLLQDFFIESMDNILNQSEHNKIILWGVGFDNAPDGNIYNHYKLKNCKLIGLRDINSKYNYVPCASCMSKLFDKYRCKKAKTKVRAYLHCSYSDILKEKLQNIETYYNNKDAFDSFAMKKAIIFLSGAEYVLTNSFHGAYWATLLNKKVILLPWTKNGITKYSDKFLNLKYKPVYLNNINELGIAYSQAKNYPTALKDARTYNTRFYKEVRRIIQDEVYYE